MLGMWNYEHRTDEIRYGGEETYKKAAAFLDGCGPVVEDWGCGGAYAKKFFTKSQYIGIDGSKGRCDKLADLREYQSEADGILLRHILEHNYDWPIIVDRAAHSFKKRLAIVFFIQPEEWTRNAFNENNGIPNLVIGKRLLLYFLFEHILNWEEVVDTETSPHQKEWILYVKRR